MPLDLAGAIELLGDNQSARRRSAAKRLRGLANPVAGPALLVALTHEVKDPRTSETQYQMVMALAASDHHPALELLKDLAMRPLDATMVYVAIGDAIVQAGRDHTEDPGPVDWCPFTVAMPRQARSSRHAWPGRHRPRCQSALQKRALAR